MEEKYINRLLFIIFSLNRFLNWFALFHIFSSQTQQVVKTLR